jgi:hypothetical protein
VTALAGPFDGGQRPLTEEDVLNAEARLKQAMRGSNVPELEQLLAPELLFVTHTGQVISRDDDLAAHRDHLIHISSLEMVETQVRIHRQNATVLATVDIEGTFAGQPAAGRFRFLRVWARRIDAQLHVIAGQATLI